MKIKFVCIASVVFWCAEDFVIIHFLFRKFRNQNFLVRKSGIRLLIFAFVSGLLAYLLFRLSNWMFVSIKRSEMAIRIVRVVRHWL